MLRKLVLQAVSHQAFGLVPRRGADGRHQALGAAAIRAATAGVPTASRDRRLAKSQRELQAEITLSPPSTEGGRRAASPRSSRRSSTTRAFRAAPMRQPRIEQSSTPGLPFRYALRTPGRRRTTTGRAACRSRRARTAG